ncbi:hypothetical protein [Sphingomonas sanxanigenens]|uniref:Uncharacterized protein n=1 Tax=Sphingomonas sanxanigenens DSM 19645 = NX02 TaxID=1123269 RepID=W0AH58_9SPHN|nr:hypothetical protein [Sphingomonas sanxanigenens]AHE55882.1 hypothetical protein NX02_21230 [Sphingomonas sanxanigenens DSM 19645 = NX02]
MTNYKAAKDRESIRVKAIAQTTEAFAHSFFDIASRFVPALDPLDALMAVMNGAGHAMVHTLHTLETEGKADSGLELVNAIRDNMLTAWAAHEALRQDAGTTVQ